MGASIQGGMAVVWSPALLLYIILWSLEGKYRDLSSFLDSHMHSGI